MEWHAPYSPNQQVKQYDKPISGEHLDANLRENDQINGSY